MVEQSHWRRLGDLLIDHGLIQKPDLEYALAIQRERGGLLGEILVTRGFVKASDLTKILVSQHGIQVNMATELYERSQQVPPAPARRETDRWKPLGRLLVDKGLLSESGLQRALVDQLRTGRLLGEIVVSRGWVSAEDVARTVADQQGLELGEELDAEAAVPVEQAEQFEVHTVEGGDPIHVSQTFLDAADLAFDLIDREDPDRVEILRAGDGSWERIWFYSRELAEAEATKESTLDRYGFPVTTWNAGKSLQHRPKNAA